MSKIPTAEEFIKNKDKTSVWCNSDEDMYQALREFAKLHLEAQREAIKENLGFLETTSEELNSKDYQPFITDDDGKVWIINNKSIDDAYPLNLVK